METLEDKLDMKATRKNIQKHLKVLGKHMFKTDILDFLSYSSSVIATPGRTGSTENKILKAMDHSTRHNEEVQSYISDILNGINKLEPEQKKLILGKYLYKYDEEEFEEELNVSMRTIYSKLAEAEIDLAIILKCDKYRV